MKYPHARILIFAKAPIPGQVKTRLLPALSATEAADAHIELVHRTLTMATEKPLCPVELWCAPSPAHPLFEQCRQAYRINLQQQCEGDIGQRMEHALQTTLQTAKSALLIGTDCPAFMPDDLDRALNLLNQRQTIGPVEVVLGPAEDGGYVLIGARRSHPLLFSNIAWGTNSVFTDTQKRLETLGWQWHKTRTFWDLDRPEDWIRYRREEKERNNGG